MTVQETHLMVAVPGTQSGATRHSFNEERFLREVHWPVKDFLNLTNGTCPVLMFFLVGTDPQYEMEIAIPLPEQNEGVGCPSYLAAEKHLHLEVKRGLVSLTCLTGNEAEHFDKAISKLMEHRGIEDRRILPPSRLSYLASELTESAT